MKAFIYKPKANLEVDKVELEFPQSSVEEMASIQEQVEKEFTPREQMTMRGFLSVEAIRADTREKIQAYIPDIFFSELNEN